MWYVLLYLIIGWVMIFGTSFIHLYQAEKNGYDAINWWAENGSWLISDTSNVFISLVIGSFMWPVKLHQMIVYMIPNLYELYDLK